MRVIVFNQGNIMHQSSALFQNSQGDGDGDGDRDEKEKRRWGRLAGNSSIQ